MVDRERLLDAAERVIARDGNGASLEAIAAEAGVTKPMVYVRIGSRAELSNALAVRLSDRLIAAAGTRVTSSSLDEATLAGFFLTTLETVEQHRELFLYVTRGGDDTSERTLYLAGVSARSLADLLVRWRSRQGIDGDDVTLAWAYGIVGMLNMVSLWWLSEGGRSAAELADDLAALVWSGLRGER